MFTTTENEPAILHAWCNAWFLGGCTEDNEGALRAHAAKVLREEVGLEGDDLEDAIDDLDIGYAPIPELEAGDCYVEEGVYDTDPGAEYIGATIYVKGGASIGGVLLRNGRTWGDGPSCWADRDLLDWFDTRGGIADHVDSIIDAVAELVDRR